MKKETILVVVVAVLIGVAGTLIFLKNSDYRHHDNTPHHDEEFADSVDDHAGHMMPMTVTSEREFIQEMIPHHQEAIDTARQVLERGATTEEIRELANGIIDAQETEIADMKSWYEEWYGKSYVETGTYEPMMRDLMALSGEELDKAFLTDMIMHHMGAIMMARSVDTYLEHEELKALTKNIVDTQSGEIVHMQQILSNL